jgi:hypothetical protein
MTSAKAIQEIRPLENPDFNMHGQIEARVEDFSMKLLPGRPDVPRVCRQLINILFLIFN